MTVLRQPKELRSNVLWAGEWYTTGWGRECYGRGNLGEGLDPQERQGTIVGEVRGGGMDLYRKLPAQECAHAHGHSVGGASLAQATGWLEGSCSLRGDCMLLVQATSGQTPLLWNKGIRGLNAMWYPLYCLQVAGTECSSCLRGRGSCGFPPIKPCK